MPEAQEANGSCKQLRFLVRIDNASGDSWDGTVTCQHGDNSFAEDIHITPLEHPQSGAWFPGLPNHLPLHRPDDAHDRLPRQDATPEEIQDLYDRVLVRGPDEADIRRFGHYLFDALFGGHERWMQVRMFADDNNAESIELALSFPADNPHLNRINWELLHGRGGFLAAPGAPKVAITRIVAPNPDKAPGKPEPLEVPPRVLFVVGTALTDNMIRPGAELYALLREARDGRAMRYRMLERASKTRIAEAVKEFEPEIVHMICHGGLDDRGRVYLDLWNDEKDAGTKCYADQLAAILTGSGTRRPTIVVLSACLTAGPASDPYYVLAGPHEAAPFATQLVAGGIPIVIGMAGHIADITSRVFARKFADAVIHGKPLVQATALARMVAIATTPEGTATANWALPAVYMAETVPPGYRPVNAESTEALWQQIEAWIRGYDLVEAPVFCGRSDVLATFPRLFKSPVASAAERSGRPTVLAILVEDATPGYGRTRLLKELAAQAFRDGHLPLLLRFGPQDFPHDLKRLVSVLATGIARLRTQVLGIEAAASQLKLLEHEEHGALASGIEYALGANGELTDFALRLGLQADLATLLADAKKKYPYFDKPEAQVVVLLDDVDSYGALADRLFATPNGLLDPNGFGTTAQPVPVVLTWSRQHSIDTESEFLKLYNRPWTRAWVAVHKVGKFQRNGEDLLACQAVLLNPFAHQMIPTVSDVPWAFNVEVDLATRKRYEARFRKALAGMPWRFGTGGFYKVAEPARDDAFLLMADDETLLAALPDAG